MEEIIITISKHTHEGSVLVRGKGNLAEMLGYKLVTFTIINNNTMIIYPSPVGQRCNAKSGWTYTVGGYVGKILREHYVDNKYHGQIKEDEWGKACYVDLSAPIKDKTSNGDRVCDMTKSELKELILETFNEVFEN